MRLNFTLASALMVNSVFAFDALAGDKIEVSQTSAERLRDVLNKTKVDANIKNGSTADLSALLKASFAKKRPNEPPVNFDFLMDGSEEFKISFEFKDISLYDFCRFVAVAMDANFFIHGKRVIFVEDTKEDEEVEEPDSILTFSGASRQEPHFEQSSPLVKEVEAQLQTYKLSEVNFENVEIGDVLNMIAKQYKKKNPEHLGLSLISQCSCGWGEDSFCENDEPQAKEYISLRKETPLSLKELLDEVCQQIDSHWYVSSCLVMIEKNVQVKNELERIELHDFVPRALTIQQKKHLLDLHQSFGVIMMPKMEFKKAIFFEAINAVRQQFQKNHEKGLAIRAHFDLGDFLEEDIPHVSMNSGGLSLSGFLDKVCAASGARWGINEFGLWLSFRK